MRAIARNARIGILRQARLPDQLLDAGCSQAHRLRYVALACNCASNGSAHKMGSTEQQTSSEGAQLICAPL